MKSRILLAAVAAVSFSVWAQDNTAGVTSPVPARGEIKKEVVELKQKRQIQKEAQKVVNEDKAQVKKDESSGASQDQIKSDAQKLKQDRKTRDDAKKEVRKERHEVRKDIRERRAQKSEAKHE